MAADPSVQQVAAQLQALTEFATGAAPRLQALEVLSAQLQAAKAANALKPPKPDSFSGEDRERLTIHDWTCAVTQYFDATNADDAASRIAYASCLLRGPALRWWRDMLPTQRPTSWVGFVNAITHYFLPAGADETGRNQLSRLQQRTSVADYTDRFRAIAATVPTMTDAERKSTYMEGLKRDVRLLVAFANPSTFEDCVATAARVDDILFNDGARQRRHNPRGNGNSNAIPMDLNGLFHTPQRRGNQAQSTPPRNSDQPRLTPLTDRERERLRSIGACFRCRQPGHTASACPLNNQRQQGNGQRRRQ